MPETSPSPVPRYDHTEPQDCYPFVWNDPDSKYLQRLRDHAKLEGLVADCRNDLDRCHTVCAWVHGLWRHDGWNEPRRPDPLSILKEVERGQRFRCVEYSTVINGCLNALGISSRVLWLKTHDVETRESGAGHVAVEAWLRDQKRWCFVDGQWNVIPLRRGCPMSAVELREAIDGGSQNLSVESQPAAAASEYFQWISPYLYYMDTRLDGRTGIWWPHPASLMLVPIGAKEPTVFQRKWPARHMKYTTSVRAFYLVPARSP